MKTFYLSLLFLIHVSILHAQQDFLFNGKIADADTKLPLQDVRIYKIHNADTIMIRSNANGEFQILLNTDSHLFFKKNGYGWHIVKITNREPQQIYLSPASASADRIIEVDEMGNEKADRSDDTDIYFNGHRVPREEWKDALSIDHSLIRGFSSRKEDGRNKFYFTVGW